MFILFIATHIFFHLMDLVLVSVNFNNPAIQGNPLCEKSFNSVSLHSSSQTLHTFCSVSTELDQFQALTWTWTVSRKGLSLSTQLQLKGLLWLYIKPTEQWGHTREDGEHPGQASSQKSDYSIYGIELWWAEGCL